LGNRLHTIEFRVPNGTINPLVWQNNLNFFAKTLDYCAGERFDGAMIDEKLKTFTAPDNKAEFIHSTANADLTQAIEIADLVFENNRDKVYFLKQAVKFFGSPRNKKECMREYVL
jgi:hypothetical protein